MEGDQNIGQPGQSQSQPQPAQSNTPVPPAPASGGGSVWITVLKIFAVLVVVGVILAIIGSIIAFFAIRKAVNTVKENVDFSEEGISVKDPRTGEEVLGLGGGTDTLPKFIEYYNIPVYPGAELVEKSEISIKGVPGGMAGFKTSATVEEMEQFFKSAASKNGWGDALTIGGGQGMTSGDQQLVPPSVKETPDSKIVYFIAKGAAGEATIGMSFAPNLYSFWVNLPGN